MVIYARRMLQRKQNRNKMCRSITSVYANNCRLHKWRTKSGAAGASHSKQDSLRAKCWKVHINSARNRLCARVSVCVCVYVCGCRWHQTPVAAAETPAPFTQFSKYHNKRRKRATPFPQVKTKCSQCI